MSFASTWMDLEMTKLSEVKSDRERQISYDTTCMWNLKKTGTNKLTYKTEIELQMEKNLQLPGRKGRGGANQKVGTDKYTSLYMKQVTNNTYCKAQGNTLQWPMCVKIKNRVDMCIHIIDSLCCTAETNTTF